MLDIKVLASGSKGNAYLVGDGKSRLLLDAGISMQRIAEGCDWKVSELAGALITHAHDDHSHAVDDLTRRGIKVYVPLDMAAKHDGTKPYVSLVNITLGTFDVVPFKVDHDVLCYGFRIKSVATGDQLIYITDAAGMPYRFEDINYWLVEANYSVDILDKRVEEGMDRTRANRVVKTHMAVEDLEAYFEELDTSMANAIWLCHLSDDNSDAEDFRERIRRVTGAPVYVA
ncbi:MBL fold metallo-hydrolase [uncultured Anaerovibrio sp.]|uniref:MBL fold metallo-hydrolase n=1 Tax=uncultured Anaerovibrio sp. TaxID=361586 RepID=UPI00261F6D5A|nr:MBL fold metallo-hydrolase [uncultured Anaerovibrio sp.]